MMNEKSRPKIFLSSYLGPEFSNNEIEILIKDFNLNYKKSKNICLDTAKLLKKGKIVGMEDQSVNRGRAEKSRLIGSKRK